MDIALPAFPAHVVAKTVMQALTERATEDKQSWNLPHPVDH